MSKDSIQVEVEVDDNVFATTKIDWRGKLSSRKFWALLAALVISCMVAFGVEAGTAEKVSGLIAMLGAVIAYIAGESRIDAKYAANATLPAVEVYNGERALDPIVEAELQEATYYGEPADGEEVPSAWGEDAR